MARHRAGRAAAPVRTVLHDQGDRPGLGLGLAISSSIVREFGGQLTAGNVEGGGAEFVVTLRASHARRWRREEDRK
jgi:signal transduction histidine kinase